MKYENNEQNNIKRLLMNIKTLSQAGVWEEEFMVFADEYPDLDSIKELNEIIEAEISYWEP